MGVVSEDTVAIGNHFRMPPKRGKRAGAIEQQIRVIRPDAKCGIEILQCFAWPVQNCQHDSTICQRMAMSRNKPEDLLKAGYRLLAPPQCRQRGAAVEHRIRKFWLDRER